MPTSVNLSEECNGVPKNTSRKQASQLFAAKNLENLQVSSPRLGPRGVERRPSLGITKRAPPKLGVTGLLVLNEASRSFLSLTL
jgi:hypothetical protein